MLDPEFDDVVPSFIPVKNSQQDDDVNISMNSDEWDAIPGQKD
jgi:hypothetical protein